MKRMTWKKTTSSEETYDVKKTTSFDETYEAKKGEKKVTSEAAYCILLKKRKYIFCRRSFFTTKHKILKSQKRQHLEQPVLMKHMTWKKQPVLRKHMTWKKSNQFWENIWGEKGKKEVTSWESIFCRNFSFTFNQMFSSIRWWCFPSTKANIWENKNLVGSWY